MKLVLTIDENKLNKIIQLMSSTIMHKADAAFDGLISAYLNRQPPRATDLYEVQKLLFTVRTMMEELNG